MAIFFRLHIFRKVGKENVFHDILEWKHAFPDHRNKKLTVEKLKFFNFNAFGQKVRIFSSLCFKQNKPEKYVSQYSKRENAFLECKNKTTKQSKNWDFFKGFSPWSWSKFGNVDIF